MRTNRPPSLVIIGMGDPHTVGCSGERSPTVAACSSIPLMGTSDRARSERLNHRARRSSPSRDGRADLRIGAAESCAVRAGRSVQIIQFGLLAGVGWARMM
jgi:hypothetical protein